MPHTTPEYVLHIVCALPQAANPQRPRQQQARAHPSKLRTIPPHHYRDSCAPMHTQRELPVRDLLRAFRLCTQEKLLRTVCALLNTYQRIQHPCGYKKELAQRIQLHNQSLRPTNSWVRLTRGSDFNTSRRTKLPQTHTYDTPLAEGAKEQKIGC